MFFLSLKLFYFLNQQYLAGAGVEPKKGEKSGGWDPNLKISAWLRRIFLLPRIGGTYLGTYSSQLILTILLFKQCSQSHLRYYGTGTVRFYRNNFVRTLN